MRRAVLVPALLAILVGLIWTGQGMGIIKGSFMTGSGFWLVVGLILLVGGVGSLIFAARRG